MAFNNKKVSYHTMKSLYPDVYEKGGKSALNSMTKEHNRWHDIQPNSKVLSFKEFKIQRKALGLGSSKNDYAKYLKRKAR